jgi:hypothetical protein
MLNLPPLLLSEGKLNLIKNSNAEFSSQESFQNFYLFLSGQRGDFSWGGGGIVVAVRVHSGIFSL